jgi:hypothetical protein
MLSEAIDTYLKVRRTLGFKLFTAQGYLVSYARFAAKAGDVLTPRPGLFRGRCR